jgi:hypothetical protein
MGIIKTALPSRLLGCEVTKPGIAKYYTTALGVVVVASGLFHGAVSLSDYAASNGWMIVKHELGRILNEVVRGGLEGCKMLRIPNCLDNRLTDVGKIVSPTHRPRSTPQETVFFCSWYSSLLEAE